jgi:hypothetical protein
MLFAFALTILPAAAFSGNWHTSAPVVSNWAAKFHSRADERGCHNLAFAGTWEPSAGAATDSHDGSEAVMGKD